MSLLTSLQLHVGFKFTAGCGITTGIPRKNLQTTALVHVARLAPGSCDTLVVSQPNALKLSSQLPARTADEQRQLGPDTTAVVVRVGEGVCWFSWLPSSRWSWTWQLEGPRG